MKTSIVGRQLTVYDETRSFIESKLAKLDKYFRGGTAPEAAVKLSRKRGVSTLEVTINAAGTLFRSEVDSDDFRSAMDKTIDNIERQIRKNKTRLAKKLREGGLEFNDSAEFSPVEFEDDEPILRTKSYDLRPMTPEDAIMQMNLLGHTFFVFVNQDTGETCVVYKRNDGGYGLLEPQK